MWVAEEQRLRPVAPDRIQPDGVDKAPLDSSEHKLLDELRGRIGVLEAQLAQAMATVESLRVSETRVRQITDSIPVLVAHVGADRDYRFCNRTWRQWFCTDTHARVPPPLDSLPGFRIVGNVAGDALTGRQTHVEVETVRSDGAVRRLAVTCIPHFDVTGAVEGVFLLGQDVTERTRTEAALRESEERYALAMRGPHDGLWDWNIDSRDLYLSARLLSILGFDSQTLRTTSDEWLKLVHPDDLAGYRQMMRAYLKGGGDHFEYEYRVVDKTACYRWVVARGVALRRPDGRAYRMVGSIADITRLKEREATLRDSEARFRSLIQTAGSCIVVLDAQGLVQDLNREAERTFLCDSVLARGQPWYQVLREPPGGLFAIQLADAMNGREIRNFEQDVYITTDDQRRVLLWNINRLSGEGERPGGVICVAQDITRRIEAEQALRQAHDSLEQRVEERTRDLMQEVEERRRAEEALIRAKEQAEEANRAKSHFLANMSHELRTPLNAIIGFAEMMELEMLGPLGQTRYRDYTRVIGNSGTLLLGIINDILDLAKIESGYMDVYPEPTIIREAAESVVWLVRERANKANIILELNCNDGDVPPILADPLRLKQILLNLLSNAVKFTPSGGRVILSVTYEADSNMVITTVADTGIGMSAADLVIAMKPFGQVDSPFARKHAQSGTGLGLPLVDAFVAMQNGTFAIDSQPGRGTTATLHFPALAAAV